MSQRISPIAGSYTIVAVALFVAIVVLCGMTFARAMTYGRAEICPACYLPYEFGAWCKLPNGHYAKNSQCNENDKVGLVEDYTGRFNAYGRVVRFCLRVKPVLLHNKVGVYRRRRYDPNSLAIACS
jgi:hypothetical protein